MGVLPLPKSADRARMEQNLDLFSFSLTAEVMAALEAMPRRCVTLGMREILAARKVRLGVFRDWHRAVVRRAAYGEPTAAFPATLLQRHPDALIYVNDNAALPPF